MKKLITLFSTLSVSLFAFADTVYLTYTELKVNSNVYQSYSYDSTAKTWTPIGQLYIDADTGEYTTATTSGSGATNVALTAGALKSTDTLDWVAAGANGTDATFQGIWSTFSTAATIKTATTNTSWTRYYGGGRSATWTSVNINLGGLISGTAERNTSFYGANWNIAGDITLSNSVYLGYGTGVEYSGTLNSLKANSIDLTKTAGSRVVINAARMESVSWAGTTVSGTRASDVGFGDGQKLDIEIAGNISSTSESASALEIHTNWAYYQVERIIGIEDIWAKVGGISGNVSIKAYTNYSAGKSEKDGNVNLMFTGTSTSVSSGDLLETGSNTAFATGRLKLYMNGTGTQKFTSQVLNFSSLEMQNGTMLMNYSATNSHGSLIVKGGEFGNSNTTIGSFIFSDLAVAGNGSIKVQLSSFDFLDEVVLENATISGTGKVTFEIATTSEFVDTVSEENISIKVISWESSSASVSDTVEFVGTDFGSYTFVDAVEKADGIYLNYTAVPEPAEFAAIFGALAVAFAAYRRRR